MTTPQALPAQPVPPLHPVQAGPAPAPAVPGMLQGWRLPVAGLALVALGAAAGHWALPSRGEAAAPVQVAAAPAAGPAQSGPPTAAVTAAAPTAAASPVTGAPATVPASRHAATRAATHPATHPAAHPATHPDSPATASGSGTAAARPQPVRAATSPADTAPGHTPADTTGAADAPSPEAWPTRPVAASPARCADCGVVESVTPLQREGQASGVGAVAGSLLGGVLGHQIGGGSGRKLMTVIGAVGGGLAGHEIEKRQRATTEYRVTLRMADGTHRSITQATAPGVGQRMRIDGNQLRPLGEDGAAAAGDALGSEPVQTQPRRDSGWQTF